jgi:hypothetical protein
MRQQWILVAIVLAFLVDGDAASAQPAPGPACQYIVASLHERHVAVFFAGVTVATLVVEAGMTGTVERLRHRPGPRDLFDVRWHGALDYGTGFCPLCDGHLQFGVLERQVPRAETRAVGVACDGE